MAAFPSCTRRNYERAGFKDIPTESILVNGYVIKAVIMAFKCFHSGSTYTFFPLEIEKCHSKIAMAHYSPYYNLPISIRALH